MTTPSVPPVPSLRTLTYIDPTDFITYRTMWGARDTAQQATIADLQHQIDVLTQGPPATIFGFDLSQLDGDAKTYPDLAGHKTLLGVNSVQNVREFFSPGEKLRWDTPLLAALTSEDGVLISIKDEPRAAGFEAFVKNTPDKFRQRPGQVRWAWQHEGEADMLAGRFTAQQYADAQQYMADTLVATGVGTPADVVRIFLWYTQVIDGKGKGTAERMIGSQSFGMIGMDCYNYAHWATAGDRYATPQELLDPLIALGSSHGLPVCVPEWGAPVLAKTDRGGARLAAAVTEQGAYMREHGVKWANWWCAQGARDGSRDQHLERFPGLVAAYRALIHG